MNEQSRSIEDSKTSTAPTNGKIEFKHVRFSPGTVSLLRDVSFEVASGTCLGMVGATGSGKSSIARLLVRLHDTDEGTIKIGGVPIEEIATERLGSLVAYAPSDPFLFNGTVRYNIALQRELSEKEVKRAAEIAGADTFIVDLPQGYETVLGEQGMTLSGGQRQRIGLARAIVANPLVIILDDATSAVDPPLER